MKMIFCNLFLILVLAVGLASTAPSLLKRRPTAWDNPDFVSAHLELYKRATGEQDYDPALVIQAMKKINNRLKIITSHRGVYGPKCPENTVCAVDAAIAAGIESVELDVREDKNGVLWAMHDTRIGRVTNYSPPGLKPFDPNKDDPTGPNNPLVTDMTTEELQLLLTRDSDGVVTEYKLVELETIMKYIKSNGHIAVVLDMKSQPELKTAAAMVQRLSMTTWVAMKFKNIVLRPSDVFETTQGIGFIPVEYSPTADKIAETELKEIPDPHRRVLFYNKEYTQVEGFLYFEPTCKMWDETRRFFTPTGPFEFVQNFFSDLHIPLGTFIPTPATAKGYYRPDGSCCVQQEFWLGKSTIFGDETRDDRTNIKAMFVGYDVLTTDAIDDLVRFAWINGHREDLDTLLRGAVESPTTTTSSTSSTSYAYATATVGTGCGDITYYNVSQGSVITTAQCLDFCSSDPKCKAVMLQCSQSGLCECEVNDHPFTSSDLQCGLNSQFYGQFAYYNKLV